MKYKHNHPSKDFAMALGLDKKAETRLKNAISKAYNEAAPVNGTLSFDDFLAIVAPYIKTAEEGFFAAITMHAEIEAAKHQYYSKGN
jgi:hypothetical protein